MTEERIVATEARLAGESFRRRRAVGDRRSDDGSAVVDFVLVTLILVPLFVAILQLGLALYVRNTLAACAQDGARYAADADIVAQGSAAVSAAATDTTTSCIEQSLSSRFAQSVIGGSQTLPDAGGGQLQVVEVRVSSPVPVFGFFGLGIGALHVQGDAMQEQS